MKMKKLIALIFVLLLSLSFASNAYAAAVDSNTSSSLTLIYKQENDLYAGLEVKTYYVATVSGELNFELTGDFKNYPVSLKNIKSQAEWKNITSTLVSFVSADALKPTYTAVTDSKGEVKFDNIKPGLYLTLSVRRETPEEIAVFEDFLTAIPGIKDGAFNYHVSAIPKHERFTPTPDTVEYKLLKQWKDNGETRPKSITADIFKDGVLQETVTLSSANNWSHKWTVPNDGSTWTAVERDILDKYEITVTNNGTTIIISNIYDDDTPPPPSGDMSVTLYYVMGISLVGCVLVLVALGKKRREE